MRIIFGIFIMLLFCNVAQAQQDNQGILVKTVIYEGDTIPYIELKACYIYPKIIFKSNKDKKRFAKLIRDVKKAYPYAKIVSERILTYNAAIDTIKNKKKRKLYLEKAEEALKKEFKDDVLKLTYSQGKILVKLIDRETGNSSYEIIKYLRGSFQAFLWQQLALIFGNDLKDKYDPKGDDKLIEYIVRRIENGSL